MKQTKYLRPMIAGLSLAILSTGALAHGAKQNGSDDCQQSSKHMMQQQAHGESGSRQATPLRLSSEMVTELDLNETQKQALVQAQTATTAMREGMRSNRQQMRADSQSASPDKSFSMREMFEQQNQRMQAKQQARQSIQGQWLVFWDSLNDQQQSKWQEAMARNTGTGGDGGHGGKGGHSGKGGHGGHDEDHSHSKQHRN